MEKTPNKLNIYFCRRWRPNEPENLKKPVTPEKLYIFMNL